MEGQTDRQTGRHVVKLTVTFLQKFCNVFCQISKLCMKTQIVTDLTVSVVTNGKWWVFLC